MEEYFYGAGVSGEDSDSIESGEVSTTGSRVGSGNSSGRGVSTTTSTTGSGTISPPSIISDHESVTVRVPDDVSPEVSDSGISSLLSTLSSPETTGRNISGVIGGVSVGGIVISSDEL